MSLKDRLEDLEALLGGNGEPMYEYMVIEAPPAMCKAVLPDGSGVWVVWRFKVFPNGERRFAGNVDPAEYVKMHSGEIPEG